MATDATTLRDLRSLLAASPFHAGLGLEVAAASPGEVRLGLEVRADHRNLAGMLHGGVVATLADTATGLAVRTRLEPGGRHVTIQLDVHYLRPVDGGHVQAIGRVVRLGKRIAYTEADVIDDTGDLVARAQATIAVAPPELEAQ
jgi:uncharacterized protein (TIGR00369 family)